MSKDAQPMGPTDFESQVLAGISRLCTHMEILVGTDGNGGKIKELDSRMDVLEAEKNQRRGGLHWLTGAVAGGAALAIEAGVKRLLGHL